MSSPVGDEAGLCLRLIARCIELNFIAWMHGGVALNWCGRGNTEVLPVRFRSRAPTS